MNIRGKIYQIMSKLVNYSRTIYVYIAIRMCYYNGQRIFSFLSMNKQNDIHVYKALFAGEVHCQKEISNYGTIIYTY